MHYNPRNPFHSKLQSFWYFSMLGEKETPRFDQHATHAHIGDTTLSPLLSTLPVEVVRCHTRTWEKKIFCCFSPYVQRSGVAFPNGLGIGKFNSDWLMHSLLEPNQTGAWEAISIQHIRFKHNTLNYRSTKISMRGHSFHCTVRKFSIYI